MGCVIKKLVILLIALGLAAPLIATKANAGVNYIQYKRQFEAQKNMDMEPAEGQSLRHSSKYLREQDAGQKTVVPTKNAKMPANKYDRSNPNH
jgi:hypothetical protein